MRSSSYRPEEVRRLVEQYAVARELKSTGKASGLRILLLLADIDRAISNLLAHGRLSLKEHQAILLHGLCGLDLRNAGALLGVHHSTVEDRFNAGISLITDYLNGAV